MAPNVPNPPRPSNWWWFWLWRWLCIGRAYLRVHGGPALRRASTSSRALANRGGDGAGAASSINSCCSWLAVVVGPVLPAIRTGQSVVVRWVAVILHIVSAVYWKCTGASSMGV